LKKLTTWTDIILKFLFFLSLSLSLSVFKDQLYSIERNVFFFYKTNRSFVFHIYIKKRCKIYIPIWYLWNFKITHQRFDIKNTLLSMSIRI
jgi:hypothetical protein